MWCPTDYHSWNSVMDHFIETSEEVLSHVALGGEPVTLVNGKLGLVHTAGYYLESLGFASNHKDAELIISITTCFLLSNFLKEYPPTLASLDGQFIDVDQVFLEHNDQFHLCPYGWPLKDQTEYSQFFKYAENGIFGPMTIFDRFPFINARTGELCVKNGSYKFLLNFKGFNGEEVKKTIDLAKHLTGFVICWKDLPDETEFRSFLNHLKVNDTLTRAIDHAFGPAIEEAKKPQVDATKRQIGRPLKRGVARIAYFQCFPDGHQHVGKSWKEALRAVEDVLEIKIDISTLKRAVLEESQKRQK